MYSYWEHLVRDPITLKDLIVVTLGIGVATMTLVLVIGLTWAAVDYLIAKGRERESKDHFKRISSHEISRVE